MAPLLNTEQLQSYINEMNLYHRFLIFLFTVPLIVNAQQLPYYTQYKSNDFMINPAITGTKRIIDARINYRMQWMGYEGAPNTATMGINGRFLKGTMGGGLYLIQDKIGPSNQTNIGGSYAYHIKFPDCELSAGVAGNYTNYNLVGNKITLFDPVDPAIDQGIVNKASVVDLNSGLYLYNDRFCIGLSVLHTLKSTAVFTTPTGEGFVKYFNHIYLQLGYNLSNNDDYKWENNIFANYVAGAPFVLDYTMRVHYKEKVFAGVSIRLKDAVALHVGYTFFDSFQISYSYDLLISKLRKYSIGSHEIMLVYSTNFYKSKNGRVNDRFLNQKFR